MSAESANSEFELLPTSPRAKVTGVHESLLQECEKDIIWYRDNFFGRPHDNLLAIDSPTGPMAISLIKDDDSYRALVRTTQGSERLSISAKAIPTPWYRKLFGLGPTRDAILGVMSRNIPYPCLTLCKDPNLPNELIAMEERQVIRSYKFGVGYLKEGQKTERDMLSNRSEECSKEFFQFLNFLGETIDLKGWKGYRAGLDVSNSCNTGAHSVYTKWQGYEVMFHVATMLPFTKNDPQKLERKRHIGNDIVNIVFQDDDTPFDISSLSSQQTHIIAIVRPHEEGYKFCFTARNGVPAFAPELPESLYLTKDAVSRDFLFHKLVNGERASYRAPSFAYKISRTRTVLLHDLAVKYINK